MALFKKNTDENKEDVLKLNKRVNVPTILQMEAVECGAASLAMVLAYFGLYIPLERLRIDCGVSRDGSKASNVLRAARKYGLEAKGYRKEPQALKSMKFPMIVHWNFNHFLVLEGFHKGMVYLSDPGGGKRAVSEEEFDQSFTGVALEFEKSHEFKKGGEKPSMIKSLLKRVKGSEVALTYVIFVGLAMVLPGLVIPVFTKIFIDDILLSGRREWITILLVGMGGTVLIQGFLTWLQQYYLLRLENKIAISSSGKFLWHVMRMPVEFFTQRSTGDISSRMRSNDSVAAVISGDFAKAVLNVIVLLFYLVLMMQYDIFLTMVGVCAAVLNVLYMIISSKKSKDQNSKLMKDQGKLIGAAMSGLKTIETLKATGSESDFFAKWAGYQTKSLNGEQVMSRRNSYLSTLPLLLTGITDVLVIILGGFRVMDGVISIGSLMAFQSLMSSFLRPVTELVNMGSKIQNMTGDMNRLDDVMKYPEDVDLKTEELEVDDENKGRGKLQGRIEIRGLSFGYSPLEPPLIEDFNLTLEPGSRVALVGGSGSGKSTVAKLISGLYKSWGGEILFDGMRRDEIPRIRITDSLAVVDQEICIFGGSIKDNITLWDDTVGELDMIRASKDACIHNDIISRQGGYNHVMQEGGLNFSGGQRQRLEIARALVNNPSILIMDEATSALDPNTERIVDESIRRRGCTCVIVAHRLSTIRDCNEIIVLEHGKIVQRGTHEQLKNAGGHYSRLINAG